MFHVKHFVFLKYCLGVSLILMAMPTALIQGLLPITDFCQNPPVSPSACQKKFMNTPYSRTFFDGALNKTKRFSSKTVIGNSPIQSCTFSSVKFFHATQPCILIVSRETIKLISLINFIV